MKYIAFSQTISFSPFFPRENEGSPLLAQNKVRADIFSGSLAVFTIRKGRFSAKEDGRRRAEGGFRGEFRPLYAFFSKSVRIFSYAHRQVRNGAFFTKFLHPLFPSQRNFFSLPRFCRGWPKAGFPNFPPISS